MPNELWRSFYRTEAERYEIARYGSKYGRAFRVAHRRLVSEMLLHRGVGECAVDVASGTGQLLPCLMTRADRVIACDLTPEMLLVSRQAQGNERVAYVQADALRLPFPDASFDMAVSSRFLHLFPLEQQTKILAELRRILRPGGMVVVDFYNRHPRQLLGPAIRVYRWLTRRRRENDTYNTPAQVIAMLRAAGLSPMVAAGVGSYFLAPLLWLPQKWLSRLMSRGVFVNRYMAEQWVVAAHR
ncbi:MAG: class I SAM-dependent methyltransferase [Sinobacteraceae bacterium]|nr:class I SAM-dependent methyltransferase [Nevskiaceae bacterium]